MATRRLDGKHILAAGEIGAFTVCPQAWKLKWLDKDPSVPSGGTESTLGVQKHREWTSLFEQSRMLGKWARLLAVLICCAGLLFLLVTSPQDPLESVFYVSVRSHGLQLLLLSAATFLVIRSFGRAAQKHQVASGLLGAMGTIVSIEGSQALPAREYVSLQQGLAGKPDALIEEGGICIPVERKPLAKKLRDRYVAQLLVYMRLVEEFEGVRPTHGYLLLGPKCRRVRVENSVAKQLWLQGLIDEMRAIMDGVPPKAAPHVMKCAKCDVRERCEFRVESFSQEPRLP